MKDVIFNGKPPYPHELFENLLSQHLGEDRLIDIQGPKVIITSTNIASTSTPELKLFRNFRNPADPDDENGMIVSCAFHLQSFSIFFATVLASHAVRASSKSIYSLY